MNTRQPSKLQFGIDQLGTAGLNLFAVLDMKRLPEPGMARIAEAMPSFANQARIILIGNGGRALWDAIPEAQWQQPDPIDRYSREAALRFARQVLTPNDYQLLYPGDSPVPLQQLGALAGWHTPSPMGIGINPTWGLWYAYRAVLITDAPLEEMRYPTPLPPCDDCTDKPCLSACPASALRTSAAIDMARCAGYRLAPESDCADRCLARLGCPVSIERRYTLDQVRYHYRLSLETLRHYFG